MCRIAKAREWATRLMHECDYYNYSSFLTLTYDNDHIPEDKSLSKDALQKFFKRVRRRLECIPNDILVSQYQITLNSRQKPAIKYFACGEYGDQFGRPHYHAIIFGISPFSAGILTLLKECWPYGFIKAGTVTYDSCRYVADYVQKKYNGTKQKEVYGEKQPPFQLQSQGLGLQYALDNQDRLISSLSITIHGTEVGIPRYYTKKLLIPKEARAQKTLDAKAERRKGFNEYYKDPNIAFDKMCENKLVKRQNVEAKMKMHKKGSM